MSDPRIAILSALVVFTLSLVSTEAAGQSCDTGKDMMPTSELREYIPKPGVSTPLPGNLELSSTIARYEKLDGEMELEYEGRMPPDRGGETDSAAVYRIKNSETFFALPRNARWSQHGPVLWFVITKRAASLRIGWLNIEDWRQYRPDALGLRLAQSYCLPTSTAP
jgi:hypothetical protein